MAKKRTKPGLDAYEKSVEDSLDEYAPASEQKRKRIHRAAAKTRTISLRINETVLENLKRKAAEQGLPYQTLISSVLYRYSSSRLIDETVVRETLDVLKRNFSK